MPEPTRKTVSLVVRDAQGRFLLQMRDGKPVDGPLLWGFFGGHFDAGETAVECAMREFGEETSIIATPEEFDLLAVVPHADALIHLMTLRRPVAWKDIDLHEGAGAGFFTRDEIDRIPMGEWTVDLLPHLPA